MIRLYEVTGMLDPLEDLETLPPHIPETYRRIVDSLVEFQVCPCLRRGPHNSVYKPGSW